MSVVNLPKIDSFLPACSSCINYKNDDYKTLIIGMVCVPDTMCQTGKQVQNLVLWRNGQDKSEYTEFQDQICDGEFLQETCKTEWHERRVY